MTNPDSEDEIRQEAIKIYQAIRSDPEASVAMIASIPTERLARIRKFLKSLDPQRPTGEG